jgi:hypothetical protein
MFFTSQLMKKQSGLESSLIWNYRIVCEPTPHAMVIYQDPRKSKKKKNGPYFS